MSYILILILILCGCSEGKAGGEKTQLSPVTEETKNVQTDNSIVENTDYAPMIKQEVIKDKKKVIDTTKIYNKEEVDTPAMPTITEKELMENLTSRFKYPDIEPVNGKGVARLTIERDGSISDVKMVKSIHPELDKEYVRVLKLFPRFKAATIDGISVRSIVDFPIVAKSM